MVMEESKLWASLVCLAYMHVFPVCESAQPPPDKYYELGCFADDPHTRDLDGARFAFEVLRLGDCATRCLLAGYPYVGLEKARHCSCGLTFGRYGKVNETLCTATCGGRHCGGSRYNTIYYAAKPDNTPSIPRGPMVYTEAKAFTQARKLCIVNGGDLVTMSDKKMTEHVMSTLHKTETTANGLFWIGLGNITIFPRDDPNSSVTNLFWLNDLENPISLSANSELWGAGELFEFPCVAVAQVTGRWHTTDCDKVLPYICYQDNYPGDKVYGQTTTTGRKESDDENTPAKVLSGHTAITLYLIIPLFLACYVGSLLCYVIHKCYMNLKRKSRYRQILQNQVTESDLDINSSGQREDSVCKTNDYLHQNHPKNLYTKNPRKVSFLGCEGQGNEMQTSTLTKREFINNAQCHESILKGATQKPYDGSSLSDSLQEREHELTSGCRDNENVNNASAFSILSVAEVLRTKRLINERKYCRISSDV